MDGGEQRRLGIKEDKRGNKMKKICWRESVQNKPEGRGRAEINAHAKGQHWKRGGRVLTGKPEGKKAKEVTFSVKFLC